MYNAYVKGGLERSGKPS